MSGAEFMRLEHVGYAIRRGSCSVTATLLSIMPTFNAHMLKKKQSGFTNPV